MLHFLLFFSQLLLILDSDFPVRQVLLATIELNVFDLRNDVRQGDENRHDHKFDEALLSAGNLGCLAIAEHGDFEALCLLAVALLEKLFEEEVGPDGT